MLTALAVGIYHTDAGDPSKLEKCVQIQNISVSSSTHSIKFSGHIYQGCCAWHVDGDIAYSTWAMSCDCWHGELNVVWNGLQQSILYIFHCVSTKFMNNMNTKMYE